MFIITDNPGFEKGPGKNPITAQLEAKNPDLCNTLNSQHITKSVKEVIPQIVETLGNDFDVVDIAATIWKDFPLFKRSFEISPYDFMTIYQEIASKSTPLIPLPPDSPTESEDFSLAESYPDDEDAPTHIPSIPNLSSPDRDHSALDIPLSDIPELIEEDARKFLMEAPLTDTGMAEVVAFYCGDRFRYDTDNDRWYYWTEGYWKIDQLELDTAIVALARCKRELAQQRIRDFDRVSSITHFTLDCENNPRVKRIINRCTKQPQFNTKATKFDANSLLAGVYGGTLNLETGEFRKSDPKDLITHRLGTHYDPYAKYSRWEKFLNEVFTGDKEMIAYIQKMWGYSLTGLTSEQAIFLLLGSGANGKSVFLSTLQALLGDYAGATPFSTFDGDQKHSSHDEPLARLKDKRVVITIETNDDNRFNEARIKQMTGGDTLKASLKFGHEFEFESQFKIWLASNHRPNIRDHSQRMWRRLRPIEFTQSFVGDNADPDLLDKLKKELPGILNWAIEGLKAWNAEGHRVKPPKSMDLYTSQWKTDEDWFAQWREDCTEEGKGYIMSASDAFRSYQEWARTRNEGDRINQTRFGLRMVDKDNGFQKDRMRYEGKLQTVYFGIRLLTETQALEKLGGKEDW